MPLDGGQTLGLTAGRGGRYLEKCKSAFKVLVVTMHESIMRLKHLHNSLTRLSKVASFLHQDYYVKGSAVPKASHYNQALTSYLWQSANLG